MKILFQNVLCFLSFVAYQYFCLANNSFTIGVLTTTNDSQINIPLESIIHKQNTYTQKAHYRNLTTTVSEHDSFEASRVLCSMMNISNGLTAVFGVDAPTSAILRSTCQHFEIPYIITSWRPTKRNPQTSEENPKYHTVLNVFPEADLYAEGLCDVVKSLGWNNFVIIYESEEGLIRLQEVLKIQTMNAAQDKKMSVLVKQLGPGPDHRPQLKEIKDLAEINIILDCKTEHIIPILRQAAELNILSLFAKVFVTSLDAHTLNFDEFKTANITTIRIFNSDSPTFNKTLRQWNQVKSKGSSPLQNNDITTETILFHDALLLFTESVNALKETNALNSRPIDCMFSDGEKFEHGLTIASYTKMKHPPLELLSKPLKFDVETGNRIDFNIHVIDSKKNEEIAVWYASNKTVVLTRNSSQTTQAIIGSMQQTTMIVASNLLEPYLMLREPEEGEVLEGNDRYEGYSMDLIKAIARIKNFKFQFNVDYYGPSKFDEKKGKWTGLVGEILEKRAHLAISDLTITAKRGEVVDFSNPYMTLGISILYKKPAKAEVRTFAFLDPFSIPVWIYTATLYLVISIILYFIARMTPGDWENPHPCDDHPEELENIWNIKNCMWLTLGAIMTQGSDILTKGISSRMAVSMWWFFSLIMANSYMANLTAFLTKNRMEPTIDSAEALAKQTKIKYGTVDGGATQTFFKEATDTTYKRMWEQMKSSVPSVFVDNNPEGVKRVQNTPRHLYAFLMESTQLEYEIETKCDLRKVGNPLDRKHYGIAMPINAPYRTEINMAILKLSEDGELDKLKQKWWKEKRKEPPCPKNEEETSEGQGLDLAHVGGIFLVLGVGLAIAMLLGLLEFMWNIRNISVEEHISYWEALKIEVKFACCIWITRKKTKAVISESSSSGSHKDEKTDNKSLVHSIMHSAGSFMNLDK